MTTDEALKILDEVTSQVSAPRNVHEAIREALRTLREATIEHESSTGQQ